MIGQYIYNVALGFDRFANAVFGGDPDWTISQRMGEAVANGECYGCYVVCRLLALIDKRHCRTAYEAGKSKDERLIATTRAFYGFGTAILAGILLVL